MPVALSLSSSDSGSRQAFGGLRSRPEDIRIPCDPSSEPQSLLLCNGLVRGSHRSLLHAWIVSPEARELG